MEGNMRQPISLAALTEYIRENVPVIELPLTVKQFSHGQSNPTYEITSSSQQRYVLRKKPPGRMLSNTAHRIEREYAVIKALEKTDVPVPKTYAFCEDSSVIGTPFYIMEFLDGRIFEEAWLPDQSPREREEIWKEAVLTLAKLHRINLSKVGLDEWKRPSRYYDRQVKALSKISTVQAGLSDIATGQKVGNLPYFDELIAFFKNKAYQPTEPKVLVHGDFKLDNLVFHKREPRVIGILDWEMATEGHPISDLVNLTAGFTWSTLRVSTLTEQSLTEELKELQHKFRPGSVPGIPKIEQCYSWYSSSADWDPKSCISWAVAFNLFRTAVIMQGIAARRAHGQASGIEAARFALQATPYALWAYASLEAIDAGFQERGRGTKL